MDHLDPQRQFENAFGLVQAARKAPFYAQKYAALPDPEDAEGWRKVPMLTRNEVYENSYPHSRAMLTRPLEGMIIISTGGSSGIARYTTFTWEEWDRFVTSQTEALRIVGIRPDDRVANIFMAGHMWPSFLGIHDCLRKLDAVHLPISMNIPIEEAVKLCRMFEPTVMLSLPTYFVYLADLAKRENIRFPALRMLNYAGEHLSEAARKHVLSVLPVKELKAGAYTSGDAGIMGYQCAHCGPGIYHVPTAFQLLEIIHAETGEPAAPGETADVVVTNLGRTSTPMIRYRLGDLAAWTGESCACGDPNPLLRLAGRAGEDFKIGGWFISMDGFEASLQQHGEPFSLNFQVEIEDVANQFDLRLRVEATREPSARELAAFEKELFTAVPELQAAVERRHLRSFTIEPVALGTLPRSPITGKVKRLMDKRVVS